MRQRTRRGTLLVFTLALCLLILPQSALAAGYSVTANGRVVPDTMAEMRSGQLMVSVRPYVEALGGNVSWNASSKMVTISWKGSFLVMWQGSNLAFQNDRQLSAPVAPYVKDGRIMVPAWWVGTRLGAKLSFSGSTLTASTGTISPVPAPTPTPTPTPSNPNPRPDHVLANAAYVFPFPEGASYQAYSDTMGADRFYGGARQHEGTDIAAPKGTPVVAVASGKVVRYGWNLLGGYRLTVQLDDYPAYKVYYAHLDRYAPGLYEGAHVAKGQLLGYVGSTGEGPEGTEGRFIDHLHLGIYDANWNAINPYPLLKYWEGNKSSL